MKPERKKTLRGWLRTKAFPSSIIGAVLKWAEETDTETRPLSDQEVLAEAERLCEKIENLSAQLHPREDRSPVELVIQKLRVWEVGAGVFLGLFSFSLFEFGLRLLFLWLTGKAPSGMEF